MEDNVKNKLCFALDVDSAQLALDYVKELSSLVGYFKVGLQLYVSEGPIIVKKIKKLGGKVFLDLKFHDIPNTVSQVAKVAVRLGVDMFNIHAVGSKKMMQEAVKSIQKASKEANTKTPIILAVTVLTSLNQKILKDEIKVVDGLVMKGHFKYSHDFCSLLRFNATDFFLNPSELREKLVNEFTQEHEDKGIKKLFYIKRTNSDSGLARQLSVSLNYEIMCIQKGKPFSTWDINPNDKVLILDEILLPDNFLQELIKYFTDDLKAEILGILIPFTIKGINIPITQPITFHSPITLNIEIRKMRAGCDLCKIEVPHKPFYS